MAYTVALIDYCLLEGVDLYWFVFLKKNKHGSMSLFIGLCKYSTLSSILIGKTKGLNITGLVVIRC